MANELIETNPAGEAIDGALPSMPKVKAHLRALPYQEVGSALEDRRCVPDVACFETLSEVPGSHGGALRRG